MTNPTPASHPHHWKPGTCLNPLCGAVGPVYANPDLDVQFPGDEGDGCCVQCCHELWNGMCPSAYEPMTYSHGEWASTDW